MTARSGRGGRALVDTVICDSLQERSFARERTQADRSPRPSSPEVSRVFNLMAKKPASNKTGRGRSTAELTKSLERIDRELIKLLNERARCYKRLAEQSTDGVLPDQLQQLNAFLEHNKGPLDEHAVRAVFRELVSGSRCLVKKLRVAYLGPQYSYSHLAAVERFGQSAELVPVATIAAVFEELSRGHANFGLVPIENSTDGRIVDTLDMFARLPVRICGEVQLRIHHHLLGKCPREEVHEVYSKPQALSQCRDWLAKHMPAARAVEMTSTAAAAQLAADKQGAAAIASLQAAANYGLNVIASNIEDNKHNVTRFAVIGGEPEPRTGRDKTALMFEIAHRSGALADVMSVFKRAGLNLTWIESFPMSGSRNEYLFFVELEGHNSDARVRRALTALQRKTVRLEVLGSYRKAEPVE